MRISIILNVYDKTSVDCIGSGTFALLRTHFADQRPPFSRSHTNSQKFVYANEDITHRSAHRVRFSLGIGAASDKASSHHSTRRSTLLIDALGPTDHKVSGIARIVEWFVDLYKRGQRIQIRK